MTVQPIEHTNQIAEFNTSRDVHAEAVNAERLAIWQARYPHDVVAVPATSEPPRWPASRASIPMGNVTTIKKTGTR